MLKNKKLEAKLQKIIIILQMQIYITLFINQKYSRAFV